MSVSGISEETVQELGRNQIWAMYLDAGGSCGWSVFLPKEVPAQYRAQDIAVFSKGYLKGYPVFVRSMENGLRVLGYPKDSFMKLTGNIMGYAERIAGDHAASENIHQEAEIIRAQSAKIKDLVYRT